MFKKPERAAPVAPDPAPSAMSAYEDVAARQTQWWRNEGIYMGYEIEPPADENHLLRGSWVCTGRTGYYRGDRHVATIGPNGSGKTRRLLMPNLYTLKDWSCVVIDPKGELVGHTALYRAALPGHRVVIFDPFNVVAETYPELVAKHGATLARHGFNPMAAALDPESPRFVDAAKAIAEALIKTDDARDPYWPMAAQSLIKGLLLGLSLHLGGDASLTHLRASLGQPPKVFAQTCRMLIDAHGGRCSALAPSLSRFVDYSADNKELGAILGTALVQTDWLDSPEIQASLKGGSFDFASLKTQPTTVYLVLPPEFLATHGIWLRLMVTSVLRPLLRSVAANDKTAPVLFMLDEFAQLGHMKIIEDNYALMRGYGVKLWTIWQDLNQAKTIYSERWESFISNAGIVQSFAPQDHTTRQYLSDLADDRLAWHEVQSLTGSGGLNLQSMSSSSSVSKTSITEPLMYPYELGQMKQGHAVAFTQRGEVLRRYFPDVSHPAFDALPAEVRAGPL